MKVEQLTESQRRINQFEKSIKQNSILAQLDEPFRQIATSAARFAIFASKDAIAAQVRRLEARYENEDLPDKESIDTNIVAIASGVKNKFLNAGKSHILALQREEYFLRSSIGKLLAQFNAARALNYVQGTTLSQEEKQRYSLTSMAVGETIAAFTFPGTLRRQRTRIDPFIINN